MKYLFSNAFKNVLRQKKAYLFFAFQILISFVIMLVFGSIASSFSVNLGNTKNDKTARTIYLDEIRSKGERTETVQHYNSSNMNYEDYLWIKENYSDVLSVSYATYHPFHFLADGEHIASVKTLFVSDEYFRNAYENEEMLDFSEKKIIFAPDIIKTAQNFDSDFEDSLLNHLADFIESAKEEGYRIEPIENLYNGKADMVYTENNTWYENIDKHIAPLSEMMIVPIELYNKYIAESVEYDKPMLGLSFYGETDTEVFNKICTHLVEEKDPSGECIYFSPLSVFEEYAGSQIALSKLMQTISATAMIITGVGFVGLILVIFNNRKKKLAIALMTGATYSDLYLEIILEIEAVVLTGALLGEILGIIAMNILNNQLDFFEFRTDTGLVLLLPVIFAIMGVVISFAALYNLFKIEPNEILKKD